MMATRLHSSSTSASWWLESLAAVERGEQLEVPAAAEIRVEARRLDEAGHSLERVDAELGVAAEQADRTGGGPDEAEHHAERGGLARPVRPQVAVDVAPGDAQVDVVDGDDLGVALRQPP